MSQTAKHIGLLRAALVDLLSQGSWAVIEADYQRLGLPWRPDLKPGWGKPQYHKAVLAGLSNEATIALANRYLELFTEHSLSALQDAIWWVEADADAQLSALTRRAIARELDGRVMCPDESVQAFMSRCAGKTPGWSAPQIEYATDGRLNKSEADFSTLFGGTPSASAQILCSHQQLLDSYGFFSWPDKRAFLFLEQLVHPTTRQGSDQTEWVDFINRLVAPDGFRFVESGRISQRPFFNLRRWQAGVAGRPKNLIFASPIKPDLRFRDAVNNDIEIVTNADKVLVYDRPIGLEGLPWRELQAWWAEERTITEPDKAKSSLYKRLRESLPESSPPQQFLFSTYFKLHGAAIPNLPALLPEVWLHWDPQTIEQRGADALSRFRMDFLLLLPDGVRIVIEVDGKQHYSHNDHPDPQRYAAMVAADRELKLAGYEVYRFGAAELNGTAGEACVRAFFEALFKRHHVSTAPQME